VLHNEPAASLQPVSMHTVTYLQKAWWLEYSGMWHPLVWKKFTKTSQKNCWQYLFFTLHIYCI